jgi:hypothetical protein
MSYSQIHGAALHMDHILSTQLTILSSMEMDDEMTIVSWSMSPPKVAHCEVLVLPW